MKTILALLLVGVMATFSLPIVHLADTPKTERVVTLGSIPSTPLLIEEAKSLKVRTVNKEVESHRAAVEAARIAEAQRLAAEEHARVHAAEEAKKAEAAKVARASQKASRSRSTAPVSSPGGIAACIRKYESGNNYQAQNPSSSASGAYQFIDGTWRSITGRSDRAKDAPPAVQDAAFYKLWNGGKGARHWVVAPKCGF